MKIKKTALVLSAVALSMTMALGSMNATAATPVALANNSTTQQMPSLAPMLAKVMPSVVNIYVEGSQEVQQSIPPDFQQFFGQNSPFCQPGSPFGVSPFCDNGSGSTGTQRQKFQALGSGVIIDAKKGYVVTNNHVVNNADKITVQLNDGRKYTAKILGKDERTDIALIQLIDFKNLTAMNIADSDQLRVGDYTVAIGNPYGLGETATSGIISALGRSGLNVENYENFIQTDAAINRGNSGGALINLRGELIGINTAILAPDGGNIGIGFAIPSNMVKNLTSQMIKYGEVHRAQLGIMGTELSAELAKAMKLDVQKGAFISQIVPKSAADKAGLKAGDIIVSLNGKPVVSFASFRAEISTMPIGSVIKLGILRNGTNLTKEAKLESLTANKVDSGNIYKGIEGAELANVDVAGRKGVKVVAVKGNTAAARIGLKSGDIILSVNQQRIENLGQLRKILDTKPSILAFNILRGNSLLYLFIQ